MVDDLESYEGARAYFNSEGIDTRPMFYPYTVHRHLNLRGETRVSEIVNSKVVVFPSFPGLTNQQIDYITEKIKQFKDSKCS